MTFSNLAFEKGRRIFYQKGTFLFLSYILGSKERSIDFDFLGKALFFSLKISKVVICLREFEDYFVYKA